MTHSPPQTSDNPRETRLLVRASLEALLTQSVGRLDTSARADRIKAAALLECAERGYANFTVAHIANRAKVSTATIYADYADRDALLVAAMEMLFSILAADVIETPEIDDPVRRVEALLLAHGQVYAQPLAIWFARLHVTLAWAGHRHLHEIGRRVFQGIDAFWARFLGDLVRERFLVPLDMTLAVPMLLGPIERCTFIAQLSCGGDDAGRVTLEEVARDCAESFFAVWGGPSFHEDARRRPPHPVRRDAVIGAKPLHPSSPKDELSSRLAHELAIMGERQTPEQRRRRILLAAAVECQERGYDASSMIEVAARANVSVAALYKHFKDKARLFTSALAAELPNRLSLVRSTDAAGASAERIAAELRAYAAAISDPDRAWISNIVMASEISGARPVVAVARAHRDAVEAHWTKRVAQATSGELSAKDVALAVNMLLGAVERTGELALILFGETGVDRPLLARLAEESARFLLQAHKVRGSSGMTRNSAPTAPYLRRS